MCRILPTEKAFDIFVLGMFAFSPPEHLITGIPGESVASDILYSNAIMKVTKPAGTNADVQRMVSLGDTS